MHDNQRETAMLPIRVTQSYRGGSRNRSIITGSTADPAITSVNRPLSAKTPHKVRTIQTAPRRVQLSTSRRRSLSSLAKLEVTMSPW